MVPRIVLTVLLCALAVAGCGGGGDDAAAGDRQDVVAAFYPLAFLAQEIGGDGVRVTNLTPTGAEPHDVELSARDVGRLQAADVVLYLGHGFQPAIDEAVRDARGRTVDLLSGFELRPGAEEGEAIDPHVWLDPVRFARIARRVGEALHRPVEAERLADRLMSLDGELRKGLAQCTRRQIVTSHAAFGYLAERYRLEQIPITGLSPEVEPSAKDLEGVVDEVRKQGATTVFFETLVSPRLARTVAREAGATTAVLDPIEGLTPAEAKRGDDYFSVMRANLAVLRKALGCR